jgi:hypothetical protein
MIFVRAVTQSRWQLLCPHGGVAPLMCGLRLLIKLWQYKQEQYCRRWRGVVVECVAALALVLGYLWGGGEKTLMYGVAQNFVAA